MKKNKFFDFCWDILEIYKPYFYLNEYVMEVKECEYDEHVGGRATMAMISIDPIYLNFSVSLYPRLKAMFDAGKRQDVAEVLCHEMSHILTEPLYLCSIDLLQGKLRTEDYIEELRERQTQRICNVIFRNILKSQLKHIK